MKALARDRSAGGRTRRLAHATRLNSCSFMPLPRGGKATAEQTEA